MSEHSFTRDEILDALTLSPCHVTGTHDPEHTPKYICESQLRNALVNLLELLGVTAADLPRRAHTHPPSGDRGLLEAAWVERKPITFTVDILPGESWATWREAWEAACNVRRSTDGKFRVYGITEGMDEAMVVGYW